MLTEVVPLDCPKFVMYLKFLKKISDSDVSNYFKIIGRGYITKDTVLKQTDISNENQAYKFLSKLESRKLIYLITKNGKKTYGMINPRTIFEQMIIEVESIDNEIGLLQEQYENTHFENTCCEKIQNLENEVQIENEITNFKLNGFDIEFCLHKKSKILKMKRFEKYDKIYASLDYILYSKDKEAGVILLETFNNKNTTRVCGTKINSPEQYKEFKRLQDGK